nr:hypothetical protein [Pandoravirus massiliensis]
MICLFLYLLACAERPRLSTGYLDREPPFGWRVSLCLLADAFPSLLALFSLGFSCWCRAGCPFLISSFFFCHAVRHALDCSFGALGRVRVCLSALVCAADRGEKQGQGHLGNLQKTPFFPSFPRHPWLCRRWWPLFCFCLRLWCNQRPSFLRFPAPVLAASLGRTIFHPTDIFACTFRGTTRKGSLFFLLVPLF